MLSTCAHGIIEFDPLKDVKRLVASFCGATAVSLTPGVTLRLTMLDLSHNKLAQLPNLVDCMPNIRVARLNHNALTSLRFCSGCTTLSELWVDHNSLSSSLTAITTDLVTCPGLKTLTIHANPTINQALKATLLTDEGPTVTYSAAYKRKSARIVGIVSAVRAHMRASTTVSASPSNGTEAQTTQDEATTSLSSTSGTVSHPVDLYLSACLPSLTVIVTGAEPTHAQALQQLLPLPAEQAQTSLPADGQIEPDAAVSRTSLGATRRKAGTVLSTGSTTGGRGKGGAQEVSLAFKQATATLARVTAPTLLAARAWLDDKGSFGADAWLHLLAEEMPVGVAQGGSNSTEHDAVGVEGTPAGAEEPTHKEEAVTRRVDLSSVRAKVPGRTVAPGPVRTWSTTATATTAALDASAAPGTDGQPSPQPHAAPAPALKAPIDKPMPDWSKTKATVPSRTVAPLAPHQVWQKGTDALAKVTSQVQEKVKEAPPVEPAPAPAPAPPYKPPDMSTIQPNVPARLVAPRKAHQQWEKGTAGQGASQESAAQSSDVNGTKAVAAGTEGSTSAPAPAVYRPPDMASIKPKVPARTVPPLKPHQQWQKADSSAASAEDAAVAKASSAAAAANGAAGVEAHGVASPGGQERGGGSPRAKVDLSTVKHSSSVASHVVPKDDRPLVWKKGKSEGGDTKALKQAAASTPAGSTQAPEKQAEDSAVPGAT